MWELSDPAHRVASICGKKVTLRIDSFVHVTDKRPRIDTPLYTAHIKHLIKAFQRHIICAIKEGFSNWVGGYRWVKGQLKCFKTADTEHLQKRHFHIWIYMHAPGTKDVIGLVSYIWSVNNHEQLYMD